MPTSSLNKRSKSVRVKMTPIEISSYVQPAGMNIVGHAPVIIRREIDQGGGRVSKVITQTVPKGETNISLSVSPVHFLPHERRYEEDIERVCNELNITKENITKKEQPTIHEDNLQFMEHSTFFDNPALDDIDFVRSKMQNVRDVTIDQSVYIQIEKYMDRHKTQFSRPSNADATPSRFLVEAPERDKYTHLKKYTAQAGDY